MGHRQSMEDTYVIQQDMGIDDYIKVSLFSVIDGHGGDHCADFLKLHLEDELRQRLIDPVTGIKNNIQNIQ